MEIKIIQLEHARDLPMPDYQTEGSAGIDLQAAIGFNPFALKPMQRLLIPTGIKIELKDHLEAQIRSRSGLAFKKGVIVLNSPGTIDTDYRGEIKILLVNLGEEDFQIHHGDRIAQMVIAKYEKVVLHKVNEFEGVTIRNEGGFGSTDRNS